MMEVVVVVMIIGILVCVVMGVVVSVSGVNLKFIRICVLFCVISFCVSCLVIFGEMLLLFFNRIFILCFVMLLLNFCWYSFIVVLICCLVEVNGFDIGMISLIFNVLAVCVIKGMFVVVSVVLVSIRWWCWVLIILFIMFFYVLICINDLWCRIILF